MQPPFEQAISVNFTQLNNLIELDISKMFSPMDISPIPCDIRGLNKLNTLILNDITAPLYIDEHFLEGLSNLRVLSISGTNISIFHHSSTIRQFLHPVSNTLKTLIISKLDYGTFSKDTVIDCSNLHYIDLRVNRLLSLEPYLFSGNPLLTKIDISKNQIKTLFSSTFEDLVYLRELRVRPAHFQCDCDLRNFRHWLNHSIANIIIDTDTTCSLPKVSSGLSIFDYEMPWIECDHHLDLIIGLCVGVLVIISSINSVYV